MTALDLIYPQYITLVALWKEDGVTVNSLRKRLPIETNTLTPILKRLESKGHIERKPGTTDERQVFIHLTTSSAK